jgi:biotin carboxyl carrier protein
VRVEGPGDEAGRRSLLVVPFSDPAGRTGAAAFVGNGVMADGFHRHHDVLSDSLSLLAGASRPADPVVAVDSLAVALLRARNPLTAGREAGEFLAAAAGARRAALLIRRFGRWRLLAASGARRFDRHAPEVRAIEEGFSRLVAGEPAGPLSGGPLARWCPEPGADRLGVALEDAKVPADAVLAPTAALILHAIRGRQPIWDAVLERLATGRSPARFMAGVIAGLAAIGLCGFLLLRPVPTTLSGTCEVLPADQAPVVFEAAGRVAEVLVQEGDTVSTGQLLARLDTAKLEAEREVARQDYRKRESEARRAFDSRQLGEYRIASLEARKSFEHLRRAEADVARGSLHSPVSGIVLTKDLAQRTGSVVAEGDVFCEVASLDRWDLRIAIDEADAGLVEEALRDGGSLPVRFALSSRADRTLSATINAAPQVSQMVYEEAGRHVVYLTIRGIALPAEIESEMRPGFSGVAKLDGPQRPWIVAATARLAQWVRLRLLW